MEPTGDDRGVSTLIGAIFLIGVLVILLSVYQAAVVPQQNRQLEFDHNQGVQDDMLDVRNAILEARSSGEETYAEVKLGTDYPPRLLAQNPPAAPGAIRTGEAREIEILDGDNDPVTDVCPGSEPLETRYLTYQTDYNEYRNSPEIVYENTVSYLNFSGETVLLTDERLIQDDTFNITPINSTFREHGVAATSVEPIPGKVKSREVDAPTIEFPSRLSVSTWEELLAEDMDEIDQITKSSGRVRIEASSGTTIEVACSPVGLNEIPDGGERSDGDTNINPVAPNDVQLINVELSANKEIVTATFRNNNQDNDAKISQVRLAFFHTPDGVDEMEFTEISNNTSPTLRLELLGDYQTADPDYEIPKDTNPGSDSENSKQFELTVYDTSDPNPQMSFDKNQDWFVIQVVFDNGVTAAYFVSAESFGIE